MVRETRHLWVGNLPEEIEESQIVNYFSRFGRVESVRVLPRRNVDGGRAAFVDFVDMKSAVKAHEAKHSLGPRELRTNYNEPGARYHGRFGTATGPTPGSGGGGSSGAGTGSVWRRVERREGEYEYPRDRGGLQNISPEEEAWGGSGGGERPSRSHHHQHQQHDQQPPPHSHHHRHHHQKESSHHHHHHYKQIHSSTSPSQSPSPNQAVSRSGGRATQSWSPKRREMPLKQTERYDSGGSPRGGDGNWSETRQSGGSAEKASHCLVLENLDQFSSEKGIVEGLHHECKKLAGYREISLDKRGGTLRVLVKFQSPADAYSARKDLNGRTFHGKRLKANFREEVGSSAVEKPSVRERFDLRDEEEEYGQSASRTLWIGNLERRFTRSDVKKLFNQYCTVLDIDVKDRQQPFNYAFVRFGTIGDACKMKRKFERYSMGETRLRIGFSRQPAANALWLDNIGFATSEKYILRQFSRFGQIVEVYVDKRCDKALVIFERVEEAEEANEKMRGVPFSRGGRLKIDFSNHANQKEFIEKLDDQYTYIRGPGGDRYSHRWQEQGVSDGEGEARREERRRRHSRTGLVRRSGGSDMDMKEAAFEEEKEEKRARRYEHKHHHHHHQGESDMDGRIGKERVEGESRKRVREKKSRQQGGGISEHKRKKDSDEEERQLSRHKHDSDQTQDSSSAQNTEREQLVSSPPATDTMDVEPSVKQEAQEEAKSADSVEEGEINNEPVKKDSPTMEEDASEFPNGQSSGDNAFPAFNSQFPGSSSSAAVVNPDPQSLYDASAYTSAPASSTAVLSAQTLPADIPQLLLQRYPVVWQGHLALKDHLVAVQMHYLAGNQTLGEMSLPRFPVPSLVPQLKIGQRMRLDPSQLDGVAKRMQNEGEHCILLALPCGRDPLDVHCQTKAMRTDFINYLQQKQAAGIVNMKPPPGSSYAGEYVLHIFPPCDFTQAHLSQCALDLLENTPQNGHLMIVVATM